MCTSLPFILSDSELKSSVKSLMKKNIHDLAAQVVAIWPPGHVHVLGLEQKPLPQLFRQIAVIKSV